MVDIYGMDSPYSQPELVGYDALGRPLYNRNARQKTLGMGGSLDGLDLFGGGVQSTMAPGESPLMSGLSMGGDFLGMARDVRKMADSGFGSNSAFGPGTSAGGLLNPTEFGAFGEAPFGYSGPSHLSEWAAADAIDAGIGGIASGISGAGPSTLAAASSTATGPGGMLAGGGATSLAPSTSSGAAAGMGPLGYGAAGIGAMLALIALGGGFDPDTLSMGAGGHGAVDASGKLGNIDIGNLGKGTEASQNHYTEAQRMVDALNGMDLTPWANQGVMVDYGADADRGFENPQYNTVFTDVGRDKRYVFGANDFGKLMQSVQQGAALGPGGLAALDPQALMALLYPELSPEQVAYQVRAMGQQDSA
jgi:hypothetical protein